MWCILKLFFCCFTKAWTVKTDKMSNNTVSLLLSLCALQWFLSLTYPFSFWQPRPVSQISLDDDIAPGNRLFGYIYLFGEKNFQESFNWACSLSECQDCRWPKAIRTLSLFMLAGCQMTEPTWQSLEAEKWRKELILHGDQTSAKVGKGLDRERSANEPENVLQPNTNITAAKDPPKHFVSVTKPRKLCR